MEVYFVLFCYWVNGSPTQGLSYVRAWLHRWLTSPAPLCFSLKWGLPRAYIFSIWYSWVAMTLGKVGKVWIYIALRTEVWQNPHWKFESRGIGFLWCVHERIWVIFSPKWRTTAFPAGLALVICKETWFSKLCGNAFGQARPVSLQENFSNFILEIGGISHRVTLQKLSIRTPKLKWFWWESQGWSGPYYINQVGFRKMKCPIFIHC